MLTPSPCIPSILKILSSNKPYWVIVVKNNKYTYLPFVKHISTPELGNITNVVFSIFDKNWILL